MRKLIFQMMVSIDGYYEDANHAIDWHTVDEEYNNYSIDLLNQVDMLLFGRKTYELMAAFWPTSQAITSYPAVAERMNSLEKIVFSGTLKKTGWNHTRLVNENAVDEIRQLKNQQGKNLAIFGSSDLALSFISNDLIDEYRIVISPVVLGAGKPVFSGLHNKIRLKLNNTRVFNSGNVMLVYVP